MRVPMRKQDPASPRKSCRSDDHSIRLVSHRACNIVACCPRLARIEQMIADSKSLRANRILVRDRRWGSSPPPVFGMGAQKLLDNVWQLRSDSASRTLPVTAVEEFSRAHKKVQIPREASNFAHSSPITNVYVQRRPRGADRSPSCPRPLLFAISNNQRDYRGVGCTLGGCHRLGNTQAVCGFK